MRGPIIALIGLCSSVDRTLASSIFGPGEIYPRDVATTSASTSGFSAYVTNSNGSYLLRQAGGGVSVVAGAFTGDCNDPAVGGCWGLAMDDTSTVSIYLPYLGYVTDLARDTSKS